MPPLTGAAIFGALTHATHIVARGTSVSLLLALPPLTGATIFGGLAYVLHVAYLSELFDLLGGEVCLSGKSPHRAQRWIFFITGGDFPWKLANDCSSACTVQFWDVSFAGLFSKCL